MHGKSHKQEARKFDRISWNSNRQSPCEINRELGSLKHLRNYVCVLFDLGFQNSFGMGEGRGKTQQGQ